MNDLISHTSPVDPVARMRALGPAILAAVDTILLGNPPAVFL